MWFVYRVLSVAAVIGFVTSAALNVLAFTPAAVSNVPPALLLGMFLVWVPTVLVTRGAASKRSMQDYWVHAFDGGRPWFRIASRILAVYGFFSVVFFMFIQDRAKSSDGTLTMLAMMMLFYGIAAMVLDASANRSIRH
jgi:hypothetical protein